MPKYRIKWVDHVYRCAHVTAESESAARQFWIDGEDAWDYEEQEHVETGEGPTVTCLEEEG